MFLSNFLASTLSWGYTPLTLENLELLKSQYICRLQTDE